METIDQSQAEDITLEENYNNQALVLQKRVGELQIIDEITFNAMASIEATAKDNVKALKAHMDGPIADANAKHKKLTKLRNDLVSPHQEVAKSARRKCIAYSEEQKRIAAEEARKQAEVLRKQEEDARLAVAAKLEAEGKNTQATQVLEAPATPAPSIPVAETVKVKGATVRWSAEIVDLRLLFGTLSKPDKFMLIGVDAFEDNGGVKVDLCRILGLNRKATDLKGNLELILPGVKAVKKIV